MNSLRRYNRVATLALVMLMTMSCGLSALAVSGSWVCPDGTACQRMGRTAPAPASQPARSCCVKMQSRVMTCHRPASSAAGLAQHCLYQLPAQDTVNARANDSANPAKQLLSHAFIPFTPQELAVLHRETPAPFAPPQNDPLPHRYPRTVDSCRAPPPA